MLLRNSAPAGRCLLVLFLLLASHCIIDPARVNAIGINYGTVANNLPTPADVVQLLKTTYISKVKLYEADPAILSAFANSGYDIIVGVPNDQITPIAQSASYAQQWVSANVAAFYPATNIIIIAVGNEVLTTAQNFTGDLLPAMQNLQTGLTNLGLATDIKVSTPHSFAVLGKSYPPSDGVFLPDFQSSVFTPLLAFLSETTSPFMINAYPYFAYADNPSSVDIAYALFEPNAGVTDSGTGLVYNNLFDAQIDATYAAMDKLGHTDVIVVVSESGWPSAGDANQIGASIANAQTYNGNLLNHINSNVGTPVKPGIGTDTYIFALFDENQKPGPSSEQHFGLFNPDQSVVYNVGIQPNASTTPPVSPSPPVAQAPYESPPVATPPYQAPPTPVATPPYQAPPTPVATPPYQAPPVAPSPYVAPPVPPTPWVAPPTPWIAPPTPLSSTPPSTFAPPPPYPVPHSPDLPPPTPTTPSPQSTPAPPPLEWIPPPTEMAPPPIEPIVPPPAPPTPVYSSPPPAPDYTSPPPAPVYSYPPPVTTSPPPPSFFTPPPGETSPPPYVPVAPPLAAPPIAGTPPYIPTPPSPVVPVPPVTPAPVSPVVPVPPVPETPPESPPQAPPGVPPAPPNTPSGPNTWCVSKPGSSQDELMNALNYACGEGGADCGAIQPGGACYDPDTLFSHASYAFSSYYALNGRNYWNCFFGSDSLITITDPSYGGCVYP